MMNILIIIFIIVIVIMVGLCIYSVDFMCIGFLL